MTWSYAEIPPQHGRVAVVTGGNGGLGSVTAAALASAGAHVVIAARNQEKSRAAANAILDTTPHASIETIPLDLASQASVKAAATNLLGRFERVDLLINNAGVMATPEARTVDGHETQLAVNHLGHWTWTAMLLPLVLRAEAGRVVTVTSIAQHLGRNLDPSNPHLDGRYSPWRAYANSKLANLHFALGLDHQFRRAGAAALALSAHPGWANSDLQATAHNAGAAGRFGTLNALTTRILASSVHRGARSLVRAATDRSVRGGTLYGPAFMTFGPPARRPLSQHGVAAGVKTLWEVSERETGIRITMESLPHRTSQRSAGHSRSDL